MQPLESEKVLLGHARRYPELQLQDAVKLLYQSEFGGGHIIPNAETSLQYLVEEMGGVEADASLPLCEDIGNGICRVDLRAMKDRGCSPALINRMFVASANSIHGDVASFEQKLDVLRALTAKGSLPFSLPSLDAYQAEYQKSGYPPVSHSAHYRGAYRPAYRVILGKYMANLPFFSAIERLLSKKGDVIVAIDGRCGSGKTTLADLAGEVFDCNIIRMDDFFLPPALRTDDRLAQAGGNIHYERFLEEVIPALHSGKSFQYRVFDCAEMDYAKQPASMVPKPLTIVEGSYSLHPLFAAAYDLKVFVTCPPQEQRRRILQRSGPELLERFLREWIPMEERYFRTYGIAESCDLVLPDEDSSAVSPTEGV